jgi:SAM-dependent methyltransferase
MSAGSIVFDRAAAFYDETRGFPPGVDRDVAAFISRCGNLTARSHVVEIGIGTGRIGLPLSRHAGAYYGVDLSQAMMGKLRDKQTAEPVHVAQADATRLPFAAHSFDAAVAVHIFHLIPTWQAALAEVERVLRPDALLLLCWNGDNEDPRITKLWNAWNAVIPPERRQQVGAQADTDPNFIVSQGWARHGDEQIYQYPTTFSPQRLVDRIRRRVFSRLWKLTDDELAAGIAAMQTAAAAHFDNPAAEYQHTGQFHVQAYLPPR